MWIPDSEGEILAAIEAGELTETSTFDAKVALPAKGRSKELAKDVAAMANDGGTLLYGIGEDVHGRPTIPNPIVLPGARERVTQIVRMCISEPPYIQVREIKKDGDTSLGYLVVVVPPSPRAPHMVTVDKDHRYYGRSDTGNVPLTEGEVARLYEKRGRWKINREKLLDEAIDSAPIGRHEDYAFLHLVARPVIVDEDLLDRAKGEQHIADFLYGLLSAAVRPEVFPTMYRPDLSLDKRYEPRADGWAASQGLGEEWRETRGPAYVLDFEFHRDGGGHLFCGRAAERRQGDLRIFEDVVAGLTSRFLSVLGGLYAAGSYLGPVDIGLAITGLRGGISNFLLNQWDYPWPYDKDQYRRTERFSALMLTNDPTGAARKLVLPLTRAITRERYDPFSLVPVRM